MALTTQSKDQDTVKTIKILRAMLLNLGTGEGVSHYPEGFYAKVKKQLAEQLVGDGRAEYAEKNININDENEKAVKAEHKRIQDKKDEALALRQAGSFSAGGNSGAQAQQIVKSAQEAAKKMIEDAKEEAQLIVEDAKEQVAKMIEDAKEALKKKN